MKTKKISLVTVFLLTMILFQSNFSNAVPIPEKGILSGYITNKNSRTPIPDANIVVQNTNYGTASNAGGYYFLVLPPGDYSVSVSVIGYEGITLHGISVSAHRAIQRDVALTPTVIPMNPVIVTATQSAHLQTHVSVSSEVLTESDFRKNGGCTAGDLVESACSVLVKDNGGFAGLKTLSIRGSSDSHVLVLLDGLRLNSAQMGGVDINTIPADALEKIEIVRGGHSALLGSDAIGGAVHMITKESLPNKEFLYSIRSTLGSFGTRELSLFGSQQLGILKAFVSYNRTESKGNFTYKDPTTNADSSRTNNDFQGDNFFLKTKMNIARNGELQFLHHRFVSQRGVAGPLSLLSPLARRDDKKSLYSIQYQHQIGNRLRTKTQVYMQKDQQNYNDPGGWNPIHSQHKNDVMGFDIQSRWTLAPFFIVALGSEYRQERLQSTDLNRQNRITQSLYTQAEFHHALPLLNLPIQCSWMPALRWDKYSDISAQVCPKMGVMIYSGQKMRIALRGNISRSFRAPSFNDLYWPDDGYSHGNPNLQPEAATNVDVGLSIQRNKSSLFQMDVTYFQNNIQDLILWSEVAPWVWAPQNVGKTKTVGFENSFRFHLPNNGAYVTVSYTRMEATDETPGSPNRGKRLIYRPDTKYDISTGFRFSIFQVNLNYRHVGKRRYFNYDPSVNTYAFLDAYSLINGNIGFSFPMAGIRAEVSIQAQNLTDKSIFILDGYPLPGREVHVSLSITH